MRHIVAAGLLVALIGVPINASTFTAARAHDFLAAQTAVYQDGTSESLERFISFLSDDIKDIHVAYGREFVGKDHFRKNMPNKARALLSYVRQVTQVTLGTEVAIVVFQEQSSEKRPDGAIRDYSGRTIMVLEFNKDGLITEIKRYQD